MAHEFRDALYLYLVVQSEFNINVMYELLRGEKLNIGISGVDKLLIEMYILKKKHQLFAQIKFYVV